LGLTVQLEKDASLRSCGLLYSFFQDFRPGFITVAPRNSILYTLNYTALPTHEIGLGEAEETIMAPEPKVWKVLFVDDEEGIRKMMAITLTGAGYQVLTAPDGATALSLCRRDSRAGPRRAVSRSSFQARCTRRPGQETIRSRPCHRAPACPYAPYRTKKKVRRGVS